MTRSFRSVTLTRGVLSLLFVCGMYGTGVPALHADALSVTVTPPLFQLTIGPGESWASTVKIVNSNSYDVTYYAQLMDMEASGEDGRSKFIPVVDASADPVEQQFGLAQWIHISNDPILVKAGSAQDVPFTVTIPQHAEPGGHYAAILVGTQPLGPQATGTVLKVSSYVSSLLFVRVKGDATESGRIREFITSQELYQSPKADFLLRFENTGNTHLRPQGDITIYNMWGKERGKVLINQDSDTNFGNVLPQSIRRFEFSWEGSADPFDIGLYSAVVTLAYGEDGKQNVSSATYFWVIPIVPVAIGILSVVLFVLSIIWFIRRYIRRALELEQVRYDIQPTSTHAKLPAAPISSPAPSIVETLIEPMREGVIDLRSVTRGASSGPGKSAAVTLARVNEDTEPTRSIGQFVRKYRLFLLFVLVCVVGGIGAWIYFGKVLEGKRGFQITDVHIQAEPVSKQ